MDDASEAEERRQSGLLLHGALIGLLVFGWVAAFAQANSAQAAFQRGAVHLHYPLVEPLPIRAWPAEVEWRADVPTAARVADGPVVFIRWTGGAVWFWDVQQRRAVGVPAVQIALARTQGVGAELARPDVPTTVSSPYRRR